MNISIQEKTSNRVRFQVELERADYQEKIDEGIKMASRTMNVPGFRKGKVPKQMIKKMAGEQIRIEAINDVISKGISDFIEEEKLPSLLYPVPMDKNSEEIQKEDPTLVFDLALIPVEDMNFDFSGKTFTKYEVEVSEEDVEKSLDATRESHTDLAEIEVMEEDAILEGILVELEGDLPKEDGIRNEKALLFPKYMLDEGERAKFDGATKDSIVVFEPYKAFNGEASEISSLLRVDKELVPELEGKEFSYQVSKILARRKAELNQDFFDRVFGVDSGVTTEEEAKAKVREYVEAKANQEAFQFYRNELKDFILEDRVSHLQLADEVIKESYENARSRDEEDKPIDFDAALKSLREELYIRELAKKHEVEATENDLKTYAVGAAHAQFSQMGWNNPDEELLVNYAQRMLEDSNLVYNFEITILWNKVAEKLMDELTNEEKKVTATELSDIINEKNAPKLVETDAVAEEE